MSSIRSGIERLKITRSPVAFDTVKNEAIIIVSLHSKGWKIFLEDNSTNICELYVKDIDSACICVASLLAFVNRA